jgi:hypothetical protein
MRIRLTRVTLPKRWQHTISKSLGKWISKRTFNCSKAVTMMQLRRVSKSWKSRAPQKENQAVNTSELNKFYHKVKTLLSVYRVISGSRHNKEKICSLFNVGTINDKPMLTR